MGNCQAEGLADIVLQQAISISDGIWTVATWSEIEWSRVCEGESIKTIKCSVPIVPDGIAFRMLGIWSIYLSPTILSG